jgi:CheY-like chemotaxis protein/putative methionine-R-sulfoxide reductase with GAF domain
MGDVLRVLVLEDRPEDAELTVYQLRRAGFALEWSLVDTRAGFEAGLAQSPDIILSDFDVPGFSGLDALRVMQAHALDLPFIIITGTFTAGAVSCLREGATDYLLKDDLQRLGAAVTNAVDLHRLRRDTQQAEAARVASDARARSVLTALDAHIAMLDRSGTILAVNAAWSDFGTGNGGREESTGPGVNYLEICRRAAALDADAAAALTGIAAVLAGERTRFTLEYPCHASHAQRWFELVATPLTGGLAGAVIAHTDVTDRRLAGETLRRRNQLLAALHDTTVALLNEVGSPHLVETILQHAIQLTSAESGFLYQLADDGTTLVCTDAYGESVTDVRGVRLGRGEGVAGRVWDTLQPLRVNDLPRWHGRSAAPQLAGVVAAAEVPLIAGGQFVGVLGVGHFTAGKRFEEHDLEVLEQLGRLAALAMQQTTLYETLSTELAKLSRAEQQVRFQASLLNQVGAAVIACDAAGVITYWAVHWHATLCLATQPQPARRRSPSSTRWPPSVAGTVSMKPSIKMAASSRPWSRSSPCATPKASPPVSPAFRPTSPSGCAWRRRSMRACSSRRTWPNSDNSRCREGPARFSSPVQ